MLEEYINNPSLRFLITTYCQFAMIFFTFLGAYIARSSLADLFKNVFQTRFQLIGFVAVLVFALGLRIYFFGGAHENTFDEFLYMRHARDILDTGQIQIPIRSALWPVVLSFLFAITGSSSLAAMLFAMGVSIAGVAGFMVLVQYISKNTTCMLSAGILLSLMPYHIFWSTRIETNIISLSMLFWFLVFALHLIQKPKNIQLFIFFIIFGLCFSSLRGENMILAYLIIFATIIFTPKHHISQPLQSLSKFCIIFLGAALLASNYINQIEYTTSQDWGYGKTHSLGDNTKFLLVGLWAQGISWGYYIFGILGCVVAGFLAFQNKVCWRALILVAGSFVFLGCVYTRIWLPELGGVTRAYLMFVPCIAMMTAVGIAGVYSMISSHSFCKKHHVGLIFMCAYMIFIVGDTLRHEKIYRSSDYKFVQTRLSNSFVPDVFDPSCHYVMFTDAPYSAFTQLHFSYLYQFEQSSEYRDTIFKENSCVVLVRDKFCVEESRGEVYRSPYGVKAKTLCNNILREYPHSEIYKIGTKKFQYQLFEIFEKN